MPFTLVWLEAPAETFREFHAAAQKSIEKPYDPRAKDFEVYVQNRTPSAYRIFWCYGPKKSEMTIIAITPHP